MSDVEQEILNTGNSFLNDLLEFIDEQEVQELGLGTADETYTIKDMGHANYIAKKLRKVRNQAEEINTTANAQIDSYKQKVDVWRTSSLTPLANTEAYLTGLLEEFTHRQLEGSTKKSIKLVEGTVQFRKQPDKFEYDEDVLLAYLQTDMPAYVKHKPSIDKAELKKIGEVKKGQFYVTGKPLPGIVVTPQDDKFEVK
jgi:hypothetical protein